MTKTHNSCISEASTAITPTSKFMDDVDVCGDTLYLATKEGQVLRESLLKHKTLLLVSCGTDVNKLSVYRSLKETHDLNLILLEENNSLATRMHDEGYVTHLELDMSSRPSLVTECIDKVKDHLGDLDKLNGVLTFWDDAVSLASRVAETLGLPGNSHNSIDIAHDKYASRVCLQKAGLPSPKVCKFKTVEDYLSRRDEVVFPCVLKPVQGAASIGVYVCKDEEELIKNFTEAIRVLGDIYKDGELMGLVFEDASGGCITSTEDLQDFVCEEYLDGPEVDIDCIVSKGKLVYAKVSDDWEYRDPWLCEVGVNYPSHLPYDKQTKIVEAVGKVVEAFGVTDCVLHCEMKYSSKYGPTLIEMNPRLGGGPCHFFHKSVYGVDLATEFALIACGIPCNPPVKEASKWGLGLLLYPEDSGTVSEDMMSSQMVKTVSAQKYVTCVQVFQREGDEVVGWLHGYPTHLGLLMVEIPMDAMTYEEACDYTGSLRSQIKLSLK